MRTRPARFNRLRQDPHMPSRLKPDARSTKIAIRVNDILLSHQCESLFVEFSSDRVIVKHNGFELREQGGLIILIMNCFGEMRLVARFKKPAEDAMREIKKLLEDSFPRRIKIVTPPTSKDKPREEIRLDTLDTLDTKKDANAPSSPAKQDSINQQQNPSWSAQDLKDPDKVAFLLEQVLESEEGKSWKTISGWTASRLPSKMLEAAGLPCTKSNLRKLRTGIAMMNAKGPWKIKVLGPPENPTYEVTVTRKEVEPEMTAMTAIGDAATDSVLPTKSTAEVSEAVSAQPPVPASAISFAGVMPTRENVQRAIEYLLEHQGPQISIFRSRLEKLFDCDHASYRASKIKELTDELVQEGIFQISRAGTIWTVTRGDKNPAIASKKQTEEPAPPVQFSTPLEPSSPVPEKTASPRLITLVMYIAANPAIFQSRQVDECIREIKELSLKEFIAVLNAIAKARMAMDEIANGIIQDTDLQTLRNLLR